MAQRIDATYPTVTRRVKDFGGLEIGQDHMSQSFVPALDEGGMVWEGQEHQSLNVTKHRRAQRRE